jgi:hypothetical protein
LSCGADHVLVDVVARFSTLGVLQLESHHLSEKYFKMVLKFRTILPVHILGRGAPRGREEAAAAAAISSSAALVVLIILVAAFLYLLNYFALQDEDLSNDDIEESPSSSNKVALSAASFSKKSCVIAGQG